MNRKVIYAPPVTSTAPEQYDDFTAGSIQQSLALENALFMLRLTRDRLEQEEAKNLKLMTELHQIRCAQGKAEQEGS